MSRIISVLAAFALLMLAVTMVVGHSIGDLQAVVREYSDVMSRIADAEQRYSAGNTERLPGLRARLAELEGPMRMAEWHRLLGIGAAIVALLVNCIVVTYFVGTTRWCREVSETYGLDMSLAAESARLKRKAFPWAILGATAIIATVALGAMADPTATGRLDRDSTWATVHLLTAMTMIALLAACFFFEGIKVAENAVVINRIMDKVRARQEAISRAH